jgi:hypothetical protein
MMQLMLISSYISGGGTMDTVILKYHEAFGKHIDKVPEIEKLIKLLDPVLNAYRELVF